MKILMRIASAYSICLVIQATAYGAITIDFTEGLATVNQQHGLTSQYLPGYGLTFYPGSGNNWTLIQASLLYPWSDDRGVYLSGTPMTLGFQQAIDFISFETWFQSSGINGQGGNITVTISSLDAPNGNTIESTNYSITNNGSAVWTGNQYSQPGNLLFAPVAAFNYVSILTPVKTGIDSLSFSPGYSGGPGPSGVPEARTWMMSLLLLSAVAAHFIFRRVKGSRVRGEQQTTVS